MINLENDMWKNVLVLVSLCLLFEDVNAQTTKNRYYKANDENVSYVGRTEIQSDGSFLSTGPVLIFVPDFREENCL